MFAVFREAHPPIKRRASRHRRSARMERQALAGTRFISKQRLLEWTQSETRVSSTGTGQTRLPANTYILSARLMAHCARSWRRCSYQRAKGSTKGGTSPLFRTPLCRMTWTSPLFRTPLCRMTWQRIGRAQIPKRWSRTSALGC